MNNTQTESDVIAKEKQRIEDVISVFNGEYPELEASAIKQGWSKSKSELELLKKFKSGAPAVHVKQQVADSKAFEAAALSAGGIPVSRLEGMYDERTLDAADKMRGVGIQEFCELACAGINLPRYRRDSCGWLEAAFSTASLPGILSNVANKMLLEGYNYVEDAWRKVCKIASVNDFKEHTRYRMTGSFQFEKLGPDGELKHGRLSELQTSQRVDTHGLIFGLTRQMIIDDNLGAFADIPLQIGIGAGEAIAEAVWKLILSNPNNFFHASHKNYKEGVDTALGINSLTDAYLMFSDQTKPNGKPLSVDPSILLVPTSLKIIAESIVNSGYLNETTTENIPKTNYNYHEGKYEVVSSSYLCNSFFPGNSSSAWYLFADPMRLSAFEVAFLNGKDRPTVEKADADFNTLGILFRGFIDFGVREQDFRGALKFKGSE